MRSNPLAVNRFGNEERDQQREKVYKAEKAALEPFAKPLPEMKDLERFYAKVLKRKTLLKKYQRTERKIRISVIMKRSPVLVKDGRGRTRGGGGWGEITLPRFARTDWYALHELAHVINDWENGRAPAAHGWQFCAIYVDLVKWFMGKEAHAALKASFRKHRVRTRPKTVRTPLSPEVRAQRIETLARARLARQAQPESVTLSP